jgi:alanyl-tRNA synthetase
VNSARIRETFLAFFEERGHHRQPSASLVPAPSDTSTLLTVAGMQPLKPYFLGRERPPASRLTSAQRCFRTPDIEEVGSTRRHLTFFEMLGNFSFGDYFKREAIAFGWELSVEGFGFDPERIWITVFGGDEELGLGPDEEAEELWRGQGVPAERIVRLPRAENFWQAGPTGPCGPCSEMYLDRGAAFDGDDVRPGEDTDRYIEYWNHVFMALELHEDGSLTELPDKNIDTGLGLERMAAIQQGVESVYDTDGFRPLIELAEELSGRAYRGGDDADVRAMRIIADHVRGTVELIADGVVPSNEDRGYVLRRIMRRAIQQSRVLGLESGALARFAERAVEMLGPVHPQVASERPLIERWVAAEEESFGRTLDRGTALLEQIAAEAEKAGTSWVGADDAFRLHDTYGFPYEMTRELLAERGLAVDDEGFEALMERQRERARAGVADDGVATDRHEIVQLFAREAPPTRFVGYEQLRAETSIAAATALAEAPGEALIKLEDSPFYAEGGGQVADRGELRWNGSSAGVLDVYRLGDDQALRIAGEPPEPGTRVEAAVAHRDRHATMRNHTATHLLHAALRELLGTHVRQAGSAVRPDKLRFDFTHGQRLGGDELAAIEERVNERIKGSHPVRAIEMAREEAERLGAMALFGEKYGEWVRMVEVDEVSRELCGGTHVANTAEVGIFAIVSEGSSASNVRRIEAITGPAAIDFFRERSATLDRLGAELGSREDPLAGARRVGERLDELEREAKRRGAERAGGRAEELVAAAEEIEGVHVVAGEIEGVADQRELLEVADRIKQRLGSSAVVLGGAAAGKVALVGAFSEAATGRGLSAVEVVREAAAITGGGGGGRPAVAQAGGRRPERLAEALEAARTAITAGLR